MRRTRMLFLETVQLRLKSVQLLLENDDLFLLPCTIISLQPLEH